jgi:dihydrofolate reductase/thymidylate synthase
MSPVAATAVAAAAAAAKKEGLRGFTIVVAATAKSLGIGKQGQLPWNLPEDMAHFKHLTSSTTLPNKTNAVIMGRRTWQSIPEKFRPLRNRLNVVLSRNPAIREQLNLPQGVHVAASLREALALLSKGEDATTVEKVFVIGGAAVYKEALYSDLCEAIEFTSIDEEGGQEGGQEGGREGSNNSPTPFADCDAFFPTIPATVFRLVTSTETLTQNGLHFRFQRFERLSDMALSPPSSSSSSSSSSGSSSSTTAGAASASASAAGGKGEGNEEEQQYLELVREIIEKGNHRGDRTQTGTLSKFGAQLRFSLRDNVFPLLTTKRVFWRGVAEELLWFVSGKTNSNLLKDKKIGIWDGNSSREYLDKIGLGHREEGDLGPVYGFQWRHFGAEYRDMHADYTGKGIDQLAAAIETIKKNPEDRRIIVSAWNPADLGKMALPPCHMFCQFYVANGELSCQMYQRSADMGLGVPFNIASYALLTRLVAQVCGLKAGEFVHTIGDAHVYSNHVEALKEQLTRTPGKFPKLFINPDKKGIDDFVFEDFKIEGYAPQENIKMKMAV